MKRIAALLGVLALTTAAWATIAQAENGFKITGGGQILAEGQTTGAGSTIAFVAQETADGAKGQVQYVDRSGDAQVVLHGVVNCIAAATAPDGSEGAGYLAGNWKTGGEFQIYVEDHGEGGEATDMIFVDDEVVAEDGCSEDEDDDDEPQALGRGNVQVHNYTAPE